MDIFNVISAFGLSASAGLNAYIPLLVVSLLAKFTHLITLKSPWDALTSWWLIGVLIFLSIIKFLADKIPAVNHVNDLIQTFVRPTAGAIFFAARASNLTHVNAVLPLIVGLLVSGGVHAGWCVSLVTATTGGAGNVFPVRISEDATSTAVSFLSILVPVIAACLVVLITTIVVTRFIYKPRNNSLSSIK